MSSGKFKAVSPKVPNRGRIPTEYTTFGKNLSPPLVFENVPENTYYYHVWMKCWHNQEATTPKEGIWRKNPKPKVSVVPWVHWNIVFKAKHSATKKFIYSIPDNFDAKAFKNQVVLRGKNSWNEYKYSGPKTPKNEKHKYHLIVSCLDRFRRKIVTYEFTFWYSWGMPKRRRIGRGRM